MIGGVALRVPSASGWTRIGTAVNSSVAARRIVVIEPAAIGIAFCVGAHV